MTIIFHVCSQNSAYDEQRMTFSVSDEAVKDLLSHPMAQTSE